jgi:hypothetical protein
MQRGSHPRKRVTTRSCTSRPDIAATKFCDRIMLAYILTSYSGMQEVSEYMRWIPELQVANTLTSLYFLVPFGVAYLNRTDDPWFSANTPSNTLLPMYLPDEPATVMGCTSTRTFCNPKVPGPEGCLNFYDGGDNGEEAFRRIFPDLEDRMFLRPLNVVLQSFGSGTMSSFYAAKSVPTLLARQTLYPLFAELNTYTGVQTKPLPSNQWQKEVEYVAQASLSSMQHFVIDYARGSWLGGGSACEQSGEPCQRTCHSQVCQQTTTHKYLC